MYLPCLLAARACLGGKYRTGAKNWKLFVDNAQLRVGCLGLFHDRRHHPAIRTVVVEELDHGDITLRISADRTVRIIEHFRGMSLQYGSASCRILRILFLLQAVKGFAHDLGMREQIVVDSSLKFILRHLRCLDSRCQIQSLALQARQQV